MERPSFTVGIEEEYLVVDAETRNVVREPTQKFLDRAGELLGSQVTPEYLQCQIEVGTRVHRSVGDAIADLRQLREAVATAAEENDYAVIAASTHPFADWRDQTHTRKPRYDTLRSDLGYTIRRMLICGCHVHVGIEDEDVRIDLMNQASYFLPHLLALSCSSPFWEGEDTGLASYRLTVFDALPRTGLPDFMASYAEYRRMVEHLVHADCIEDATKIWWDIRPSDKFPTVEQRVTDVCSRLEDTATIAALFQTLMAFFYRIRSRNQRWRVYPNTLINENRWRAQRYGTKGDLVDHGRATLAPFSSLVEEIIDLVATDAEALGCVNEIRNARVIAREGSSANRQRRVFEQAMEAGAEKDEAMRAVVDSLVSEFTRSPEGEQ